MNGRTACTALALFAIAATPVVAAEPTEPKSKRRASRKPDARTLAWMRALKKTSGAKQRKGVKPLPPCQGLELPRRSGALPWKVGEELGFEITSSGMLVGRLDAKVGKPRRWRGKDAWAFFGRARTNLFISSIKRFEGRYMALSDPETMLPYAVRTESLYGDDPRNEKVLFSDDRQSVSADFFKYGKTRSREYERNIALQDVLTMLYYARSHEYPQRDQTVCQEVFANTRLWRMEATVRGQETVSTPGGKKTATKVEIVFQKVLHKDLPTNAQRRIELDLLLSTDRSRVPLGFTLRTQKVDADVKLVRWKADASPDETTWSL